MPFQFERQTWKIDVLTLASALLNLLLNVALIPSLGMKAAAYTTVGSCLAYSVLTLSLRPRGPAD